MTTRETHQQVADYIKANPKLRYWEVALNLGISTGSITTIAKEFGLARKRTLQLKNCE